MVYKVPLPSQDELNYWFRYDSVSGDLYWRNTNNPQRVRVGDLVKTIPHRSAQVRLNWVRYHIHRVIWKMVHNEEPEVVDHINGVPHDNRLVNLQRSNFSHNTKKMAVRYNSVSCEKYVTWDYDHNRWRVCIRGFPIRSFLDLGEAVSYRDQIISDNNLQVLPRET